MHTVMRLLGAVSGLVAALALGLVLVLVAIPTTTWAGSRSRPSPGTGPAAGGPTAAPTPSVTGRPRHLT